MQIPEGVATLSGDDSSFFFSIFDENGQRLAHRELTSFDARDLRNRGGFMEFRGASMLDRRRDRRRVGRRGHSKSRPHRSIGTVSLPSIDSASKKATKRARAYLRSRMPSA
jgi:hypothetical protein